MYVVSVLNLLQISEFIFIIQEPLYFVVQNIYLNICPSNIIQGSLYFIH
jgi:hypothetical protein